MHWKKNKHLSTKIRKKWRKSPPYKCCLTPLNKNINKLDSRTYCGSTERFYKSRERKIFAYREIYFIERYGF